MKLKAKLAEDYVKGLCGVIRLKDKPNLNAFIPDYMADAFLAGFEKARDIIAESLNSFTIKTQWSARMMTGGYISEGESKEESLSECIRRVGEEEASG